MIVKRLTVALMVLGLGSALGSCAGLSGAVSDHWPRWAGGMPGDVPPRPGTPGYDNFVAHNQPDADATKPVASDGRTDVQPATSGDAPPNDPAVARGGLY